MDQNVSRLFTILTNCYLGKADPPALNDDELREFLQLSRRHRVEGLLYYALHIGRNDLDANTWLLSEYIAEQGRMYDLRSILSELETAGIAYYLIKGFFFNAAYPAPALRKLKDIDIIVEPDALERLGDILTGRGYVPGDKAKMDQSFYKNGCFSLEVHFLYWDDVWLSNKNIKKWKKSWKPTPYSYEGLDYTGIPVEDEMINYMLHLKKHYICGTCDLRFLFDFLWVCKHYNPDWPRIQAKADAYGVSGFCAKLREFLSNPTLENATAARLADLVTGYFSLGFSADDCAYPYISHTRIMSVPVLGKAFVLLRETARNLIKKRMSLPKSIGVARRSTRLFGKYLKLGKSVGLTLY